MNVFDLAARITLDTSDYEQGLDDAGKKTSSFGSKLKSGLATAAKVGAAAVTAAGAAVGAIVKKGVEEYANYEQLIGGVETLFKNSADKVQTYAAWAYETAGLSANEYMETVTSFSASLLQSLGGDTDKAADVADQAITDMSDNANKMGTSMELIQNAYQGFAKANYTMLDNLKLGYGGTKEEMQRLIDDANKVKEANGEMADLSIDSFADITEAIHIVQTEMDITGTTAKEASTTISGSLASVKAQWHNLLTAMSADGWDIGVYVDNLVDTVKTAAGNIIPVISQALSGIGEVIQGLAPIIAEELPILIETVVPSLLAAGGTLLTGLINGIIVALPSLIDPAIQLINQLSTFIIQNLPLIVDAAIQIIIALANGLAQALPELIPAIVQAVITIAETLIKNIPLVIDAAFQIMVGIVDGIMNAFPLLGQVWDGIKEGFSAAWEAVKTVWNAAKGFFSGIWNAIKAVFSVVSSILTGYFSAAWNGIKGVWNAATGYFQNIWNTIKGIFSVVQSVLSGDFRGAWNAIKGIFDGWGSYFTGIWNNVKNIFKSAIDKLKSFFHFDWSLPKIKLPHFSITGSFSLSPPSIPHISVSWYKKAMDNAMLLNGATIFGMSGNNLLGGGEAGPEVVSGADTLMNMISKSVKSAMGAPVINITVNGANIQDDQTLAEKISFEVQMMLDRRRAAFGRA